MPDQPFQFHVQGPKAAELAKELADELEEILGQRPTVMPVPTEEGERAKTMDPALLIAGAALGVASAALIIALPGSILSTIDLAKRAKLKEKVGRLVDAANKALGHASVLYTGKDGAAKRLHEAKEDELVQDILARRNRQQ